MRYNDIKVYKIFLNIWKKIRDNRFSEFWKISNSSRNKLYQKENSSMANPTKIQSHPSESIWILSVQLEPRWIRLMLKQTVINLAGRHCIKSVRLRSYSGLHFLAFGLNTERYGVSLRIQFECGKIRTRKTPNADTFHAMRM